MPLNRETKSYSDAVLLARHLLRNIHRELSGGVEKAWCFLWPTPNAVEAGLREIVRDELEGLFGVTKTPVKHGALSFNPDLVIGDFAVGDVKYSLDTGSWRRSDVNQLLSFSAAFDRTETLLLNFSPVALQPEQAQVRRVRLTRLAWAVDVPVTAAESEFRAALRTWLSTCSSSIGSTP